MQYLPDAPGWSTAPTVSDADPSPVPVVDEDRPASTATTAMTTTVSPIAIGEECDRQASGSPALRLGDLLRRGAVVRVCHA